MDTIEKRLQAVKSRIARACAAAGRDPRDIVLVAVSKTFPAAAVRAAHAAGQRDFGENHAQDAVAKIEALADLDLVWHFIGPIQSNKTRTIAEHFAWVHSIDRLKIAERLAAQRPGQLAAAAGLHPGERERRSDQERRRARGSRRARARGRRAAAAAAARPDGHPGADRRRRASAPPLRVAARPARTGWSPKGSPLDTLSMGMSDDLEAAIAAGATMVRVGTAIFGARPRAAATAG